MWDHVHDTQITKSARIIGAYRTELLSSNKLNIKSQLLELSGKSGVIAQTVTRASGGEAVADARLTFVCIDLLTQKAQPVEGELKRRMEEMFSIKT
ncbi:acyl-CoA thioesterase [Erwinia mallotivora]|uniref:acyl-CoA thioesterase n=1 Tax=Erwinia mallotivora TaxID=69222 RepID=UPI0035E52973